MSDDLQQPVDIQRQKDVKLWAMLIHFSLFAGYVVPFAGLIAPILLWQIKKADLPEVDAHGKMVVNWIISSFIYLCVGGLLTFVLVGFAVMFAVAVMAVVFPIVGGIKANNGEFWKYPLTIEFIK
ncbi:MAG: DUF4870 domain-containing protein [Planctomycetales bacterium]|nr:DUF4870 domain-containing protein [Planctomycetales bacterium]